MVHCPKCEHDSTVKDSRWSEKKKLLFRRRLCLNCKLRWSTVEVTVETYERLSNAQVQLGILKAITKE